MSAQNGRSSTRAERWVVKIGSSLITNDGRGLNAEGLDGWVAQVAALHEAGHQVILVSSGAVAEGMARLGLPERPAALHMLQAAAAVGQMGVVEAWESRFNERGIHTAQVLLSHDDLAQRGRYLNARSTLRTLLDLRVIPVVNENDTVATEEIRLGDNDTLAALTVNLVEADRLVIMTDQDGLFDADPRDNPSATLIKEARAGDPALEGNAGPGIGRLGRGGMQTKVQAAALAARSGAATWIVHGGASEVLARIASGESVGTHLTPDQPRLTARKRWIAGQATLSGRLTLDDGAVRALREEGKSLLPVGVSGVEGAFERGDLLSCVDSTGGEVARGLVNYSADEAQRLIGRTSADVESVLGYAGDAEMIHRDNLVIV